MIEDIRARAKAKVKDIMSGITREVSKEEQDFWEADFAYEEVFGDSFYTEAVPHMSHKEMTELMLRCIEEGKPFEPDIPEGAIP